MSVLRSLRRQMDVRQRRTESFLPDEPDEPGGLKMSQVLLDYAQPLIDSWDDGSKEPFEDALRFAVLCWNISLMPPKEQRKAVEELLDAVSESPRHREQAEQTIISLIDEKKAKFAHVRRFILNFAFVDHSDGPKLLVASTPMKPK